MSDTPITDVMIQAAFGPDGTGDDYSAYAMAMNTCRDLERQLAEAREQRDRLAEILRETIAGYDVVSETISLCSGYVATVIDPALAAMKGGKP